MINYVDVDFGRVFFGKVIKVYPETRSLDIYIPKLMQTLSGGAEYKSEIPTIDSTINLDNEINIQDTVRVKNTIRATPMDYEIELPSVGSDVQVIFIEGDPKRPTWYTFNPNGTNDYALESEKYPYLGTVNINNKGIDVFKSKTLDIDIDEEYFTVLKRDNKFKITLNKENVIPTRVATGISAEILEDGNLRIQLLDQDDNPISETRVKLPEKNSTSDELEENEEN